MAHLYANDTIKPSTAKQAYGGPSSEYQEQLRKEHSGSKWGTTGARYSGNDVLRVLNERPYIQTVLDFGAGKGSLGEYIRETLGREIEWTNYDPGIPEYDILTEKQYDCVINTDVLEHVEPDYLLETLASLAERTGKVLVSDIACYPTGHLFGEGPYKGLDMHLIVEEPTWWRTQFEITGLHLAEFEWRSKFSKGRYKDRCFMIHERV